jgi:CBS domain containing-hemolysin-like protein
MLTLNLFLIAFLIAATAFFVATEFAIIKIRPSRVDQMVMEGKSQALAIQKVTSNLDGYLSACQLGITVTALGLGWLGEPTVEKILHPLFEQFNLPGELVTLISFIVAFALITFLHVVIGELAPKSIAIQKAEMVSIICARPIIIFYKVMYPFIWLLNGSANQLIRLFGLRPAKEHEEAHSEEELRIILSESYKSGKINQSEYGYVNKIFAFDDLMAKEIMVPRTDMVCLDLLDSLDKNIRIMREEQYTRFPVIEEDKDHVIGMINTKKYFLNCEKGLFHDLQNIMQPVLSVPDTTAVKSLLKKMQKNRVHMAILLDEYGGTSGLITIEDILEEIVGEIRDEFDAEEGQEIEIMDHHHMIVDGKVSLSFIFDQLGVEFDTEGLDTIGGWLYMQNPTLNKGDSWDNNFLKFTVLEKERHRIRRVDIRKLAK